MPVGWGWVGCVSGKVHSEHIVATKVLMPMGGWVGCLGKCTLSTLLLQKCSCPWGGGCLGKCTLSTLLLQKCSCPWGGGGCLSGKVHPEHIVATKVLMPMGGWVGCLGKCTLSTLLLQKCSCPWEGGLGVWESALWAHCCYKSAHTHGRVGWVSGKVHSDTYGEKHFFENRYDSSLMCISENL